MFDHGWNNYMQHAYPEDELNPFKCTGRGSDKYDPNNININDVLGDYSLTLVDTLDTLAILGTQEQFEQAVDRVIKTVSFSQDNKVQVFEVNIRALGGLLSAHMLATDPSLNHTIQGYNDELLHMAQDLADRLMPAFQTSKTGIPFPRVNLKRGVPPSETTETCTAGAGSLILEFGVLSRLTGDPTYEQAAKKALRAVWSRRSHLNLLGNVIDIQTGRWIHTASSTGAGIDSVFEYMLKAYVLFGEQEYKDMFDQAYKALLLYVRDQSGYLYRNVHMSTGSLMSYWIDSLSAFFPGLQVLQGDLDSAIKHHLVFYNIWRRYHALPERFDFYQKTVDLPYYPLRPEFIESTYHLYMATKDPFYLEVGEMVVEDLNNRTRVPCGFASIGDVRSGRLEDRMESFMLSETLKYLYLLFDVDNSINTMDNNYVFTTEGHVLGLPKKYLYHHDNTSLGKPAIATLQQSPAGTCQRYNPSVRRHTAYPNELEMTLIPYQPHMDVAAHMVGHTTLALPPLSQHGYCESPHNTIKSYSVSFGFSSPAERFFKHQHNNNNLMEFLGGYLAKSLSGLKIELISGGSGGRKNEYLVKGVHPPTVSFTKNQTLTVPLHALFEYLSTSNDLLYLAVQQSGISKSRDYLASDFEVSIKSTGHDQCFEFIGLKAEFGPAYPIQINMSELEFISGFGCDPIQSGKHKVMVISRGQCTFEEKAWHAQQAGARAVVFLNNQQDQTLFRVAASGQRSIRIPSVLLKYEDSLLLVKNKRIQQFSMQQLGSVDQDPKAKFVLYFQNQIVRNLNVMNV
ncbi:ER degradation enhancer, mannosidase alpha-like 1 [Mucor circinelloides 1006PhL]|uniref:alpha-1,2-Mannosidase n=1 Tax=Mucor circinelloides f. circinelloides (strain 1006PhL) TaxID=1220926 RepID=S2JUB8_MUCC1|nr:ER degradation enhancer, mannosidase alpha-like 1 [Mucor circinelloides 1006PhL]